MVRIQGGGIRSPASSFSSAAGSMGLTMWKLKPASFDRHLSSPCLGDENHALAPRLCPDVSAGVIAAHFGQAKVEQYDVRLERGGCFHGLLPIVCRPRVITHDLEHQGQA